MVGTRRGVATDCQGAGTSDELVLLALWQHGDLTHRELAEVTGYSQATVTAGVNAWRDRGLIEGTAARQSHGLGRPSTRWRLRPGAAHVAAVDVGATKVRAAVLDLAGTPISSLGIPTRDLLGRAPGGAAVARELAALVRDALAACGPSVAPAGVGVAVSGLIDAERGICLSCANIAGWRDLSLAADMSALLSVPCLLDDSARAQALYEHRLGAAQGYSDFLYVNVGIGIGAAIFINGSPYRGTRGLGSELGHITVDERGPRCGCGNLGCAEAMVGAPAIVRQALDLLRGHGYPSVLGDMVASLPEDEIGVEHIAAAANQGDPLAYRVLNEAGEHLGVAVAAAVNLLGTPLVVLGGGIVRSGEPFLGAVRRTVLLRALPPLAQQVQIEPGILDDNAGTVGIGLAAVDAFLRSLA